MVKRLFSMMLAVMLVFNCLSLDTFAIEEQSEEVQTETLADAGGEGEEKNTMEEGENTSEKNTEEQNESSTDSESGSVSEASTEGIELSTGSEIKDMFESNFGKEDESSTYPESEETETETVIEEENEIAIDSEENASLISGNAVENEYTWNFSDVTVGNSDKKTVDYNDEYAAIRVGLGAGDSFESNSVQFSNPSCKETNDTSGFKNASETNRYILIKPKQAGTIRFSVQFDDLPSGKVGRVYYIDHGETEISKVMLTDIKKGTTGLGADFKPVAQEERTFDVRAGHVYSIYTYQWDGKGATISGLSMEKSLISGSEENGIYTWKFNKNVDVIASGEKKDFQYSDAYASIRVGLGSGDSVADGNLQFSGPGCKDEDGKCPGYENVSKTNRYILIKPKQAGTIRFLVQFAQGVDSKHKGRVYYIDHGETEIGEVILTDIKKTSGTNLGADFTSTTQEERSFNVQAGHVYSIYTYQYQGYGATIFAKAKVKLQNKFYYTGSDIIPKADDLKVTLKSGKSTYQLELGTDYKLIPYPNNPKKGKLKFLLAGQNDFGGTKTVTITVRPQIMKWR